MMVGSRFAPAALAKAKNNAIQCYTPQQLEARLFNFAPYLARLRAEFEQSRLATGYVEQYLKQEETDSLLDIGLKWVRGEGGALWVVLGDYGTGKTAFTQKLAYELAREIKKAPEAPVPLLINLRDYPNKTSLESVLEEHLAEATDQRGRSRAVLHLIEQGRVILLLDSFDEMGIAAMGVSVADQFRQLTQPVAGSGRGERLPRILITCREEFFRERKEVENTVDGGSDSLARADSPLENVAKAFNADIQTLAYFKPTQVRQYLTLRLGEQSGESALRHLQEVPGLADIATRPQLLEIVL